MRKEPACACVAAGTVASARRPVQPAGPVRALAIVCMVAFALAGGAAEARAAVAEGAGGWQRSAISVTGGTPVLKAIDMVDANVGWAAGDLSQGGTANPDGLACVTIDGGVTWRQSLSAPGNTGILGVAAIGALDAWLVGFDYGHAWVRDWGLAMYRTRDGGASWQWVSATLAEDPGCQLQFVGIDFVGSQLGWAIGGPT